MGAALRQYPADRFACEREHRQPAEVGEHQSAHGDRLSRYGYHARSRAYAALQVEARHAAPSTHRAAGYVVTRPTTCSLIVFAGDRQRLDIVQVTVVAFEHERIHRRPFTPDLGWYGSLHESAPQRSRRHRTYSSTRSGSRARQALQPA